jgi:hypothetical protein
MRRPSLTEEVLASSLQIFWNHDWRLSMEDSFLSPFCLHQRPLVVSLALYIDPDGLGQKSTSQLVIQK